MQRFAPDSVLGTEQLESLLELKSLLLLNKRYFSLESKTYKHTLESKDGVITARAYLDDQLVSEVATRSFFNSRFGAAALVLEHYNKALFWKWLSQHKSYLSSKLEY